MNPIINRKFRKLINSNANLDSIGLFLIALFSFCYLVFIKRFAERHIQFSFLDFPIFMGEILLFLCLILLLIKWKINPQKFNIWYYLLLFYFGFVLIKAFYGYSKCGPLAFRHAAMFYYPLFAVFGYTFYRRSFFSSKKILFLALLLIFILRFLPFYAYAVLTCFVLAFVLIKAYPHKNVKYILFSLLLILTPYSLFFQTSRSFLVSNLIAGVYIIIALIFIMKIKTLHKVILFALIIGLILTGIFKLAYPLSVKSLLGFKDLVNLYETKSKLILDKKETFRMQEVKHVKLYNPEVKPIKDAQLEIKEAQLKIEEIQFKDTQLKIKEAQLKIEEIQSKIDELKSQIEQAQPKAEEIQLAKRPSQPQIEAVPPQIETEAVPPQQIEQAQPRAEEIQLAKRPSQPQIEQAPSQIETEAVLPQIEAVPSQIEQAQPKTEEIQLARRPPQPQIEQAPPQIGQIQEAKLQIERLQSQLKNLQSQLQEERVITQRTQAQVRIKEKEAKPPPEQIQLLKDLLEGEYNNALFRIFIWKDMLTQLKEERPLLGFDFGKPFRSKSLEILGWGETDWRRDGWITAHNSYLHIIYRSGSIGILFILSIFILLFKMIKKSIRQKLITGILLCGILINWLIAANFLLILELPYNAIPFWSLFGMTLAYLRPLKRYAPIKSNIK